MNQHKKRILQISTIGVFITALIIMLISVTFLSLSPKGYQDKQWISDISKQILDSYDEETYYNNDKDTYQFVENITEDYEAPESNETWSSDKQAEFRTVIVRVYKNEIGDMAGLVSVNELEDGICVLTFDSEEAAFNAHSIFALSDIDVCYETVFNVSDETETEDVISSETELVNNTLENLAPVKVAVLDTGYTGDSAQVINTGINTVDNSSSIADENGHGTRMINIIDELTYDNVSILPIKVANEEGFATILSTYAGIKAAIAEDVNIINLSLNSRVSENSFLLEEAIREATNKGILVVVSAGNRNIDVSNVSPSNVEEAIVVSAVDENDAFESYSNYGSTIDYATYGNYNGASGTSISAARMTGMYAYVKGMNLNAEDIIRKAAVNPNNKEWDDHYGYGIVNPYDVYESADRELASNSINSAQNGGSTWQGKTGHDIGPNMITLDWKNLDTDELDLYLQETHYAFVGELIHSLTNAELAELTEKSNIMKSTVEETVFSFNEDTILNSEDLTEFSKKDVPFVEYCLSEYELHKNELTTSAPSNYWWYNNSVGVVYLNDNHGITKFTIVTPPMNTVKDDDYIVNSNGNSSILYGFVTEDLLKAAANNGGQNYIRIGKTYNSEGRSAEDSPSLRRFNFVYAGNADFITMTQKNEESNLTVCLPNVFSIDVATGQKVTMFQFEFENYDVGIAEPGQSWKTPFFGSLGSAKAYDFNVRPYGYWAECPKQYWENPDAYWSSISTVPSGKKYQKSQLAVAIDNYNNQLTNDWAAFFGSTEELQPYNQLTYTDSLANYNEETGTFAAGQKTADNVIQFYVHYDLEFLDPYVTCVTDEVQTIRKAVMTTKEIESADVQLSWCFPNGTKYSEGQSAEVAAYQGETYDTVKAFLNAIGKKHNTGNY